MTIYGFVIISFTSIVILVPYILCDMCRDLLRSKPSDIPSRGESHSGMNREVLLISGLHLGTFCSTVRVDTKDPEEADDPEGHSPIVSESSASTKVATEDQCQMIDCQDRQEMVEDDKMREFEASLTKLATNIAKAWPTLQLPPQQVIQALKNPQSMDHAQVLSLLVEVIEERVQDQDLKRTSDYRRHHPMD